MRRRSLCPFQDSGCGEARPSMPSGDRSRALTCARTDVPFPDREPFRHSCRGAGETVSPSAMARGRVAGLAVGAHSPSPRPHGCGNSVGGAPAASGLFGGSGVTAARRGCFEQACGLLVAAARWWSDSACHAGPGVTGWHCTAEDRALQGCNPSADRAQQGRQAKHNRQPWTSCHGCFPSHKVHDPSVYVRLLQRANGAQVIPDSLYCVG